jgi:predicted DNA-binding protein (MmcQ/YjbR family)
MTRDEFNIFCATLPKTTHVIQWGNAHVWKVGGKVFAISGWNQGQDAFTFKASEIALRSSQINQVSAQRELPANFGDG